MAPAYRMPGQAYQVRHDHVSRAAGLGVSRDEILETTAVAVSLWGEVADWPAGYVFKVLEEIEKDEKAMKK